jgi:hypothetical protein
VRSSQVTPAVSWRAAFLNGPLAGPEHDRRFASAAVHERLWLAQVPDADRRVGAEVWSVVGTLPGSGRPIEEWPEQVEYELDAELSQLDPPAGEGFAVFRLVA